MPLVPGTKLGPFEIAARLGTGGMGEVYRARDTRLGRDVAIKVLPEAFAADPDRLRRFEQEARSIAALNHPNICQLHDVGPGYLVLEYVPGDRLCGPTAVGEARGLRQFVLSRAVCRGATGLPLAIALVQPRAAEGDAVEFFGYVYEEELACAELPPVGAAP